MFFIEDEITLFLRWLFFGFRELMSCSSGLLTK